MRMRSEIYGGVGWCVVEQARGEAGIIRHVGWHQKGGQGGGDSRTISRKQVQPSASSTSGNTALPPTTGELRPAYSAG